MKSLKRLLTIHAIITLAAAIVLIADPALIPRTVDIEISRDQYLLSYFLGAAELGIAYLSFKSTKINDRQSLRIITTSFIIFHFSTALLEVYGLFQDMSSKLIANIILRLLIVALLYYYGVYKNK